MPIQKIWSPQPLKKCSQQRQLNTAPAGGKAIIMGKEITYATFSMAAKNINVVFILEKKITNYKKCEYTLHPIHILLHDQYIKTSTNSQFMRWVVSPHVCIIYIRSPLQIINEFPVYYYWFDNAIILLEYSLWSPAFGSGKKIKEDN